MTTAAVYIRKSREEAGKPSHRLTVQREQLPAHAKAQGWKIAVYDDGHASAARGKVEDLRERSRLEADIRAGQVQVILCIELSRLSRDDSLQDYVSWLHLCAEYCVKLATPSRTLDPAQPSDWMLLLMEGGFSSVEMKILQRRMAEGRRQAYNEGRWMGGTPPPPYTYNSHTGQLAVDQKQLAVWQRVWSMAESQSARSIARTIGLPEIAVRRNLSDDRLLVLQAKRIDHDTGETIPCNWPAVLEADQAERIRAARRTRRNNVSRRDAAALLSNLRLIYCGYCGRTVKTWTNQKSARYYGCNTKNSRLDCRDSRLIRQAELDDRILTNIFSALRNSDQLQAAWAAQSPTDTTDQIAAIDRDIQIQNNRRQRLVAAVTEGIIDFADAKETRLQIDAALDDLKKRRQAIQTVTIAIEPDWASLCITRDEFSALDFDDQRELLAVILERIDLYYGHAILTYRFPRTTSGNTTSRINLDDPQRNHHTRTQKSRKP